jgi:DinB superfamily
MIDESIKRLDYLCHTIPHKLLEIHEAEFSAKPLPNQWSKKEIIGHLIDSATNNHQRFVRCQFEDVPTIIYDQNKWNEFSFYQNIEIKQLIEFWAIYNKQLVEICKQIPKRNLPRECQMKDGTRLTLEFLINDYVTHLEHHLAASFNI